MAASSSIPIKETVYGGPAIETVYRGPATSSTPSVASTQTVYDPSQHQGRAANGFGNVRGTASSQGAKPEVKRAAYRLFIIGGLSMLQFAMFRESNTDTAIAGLVISVIFCILGMFALRMSKAAFIIGMEFAEYQMRILLETLEA